MTPQSTTAKICALCNQDCSDRPRLRDAKGRYYCVACHEAAASHASGSAASQLSQSGLEPALDSADLGFFDTSLGIHKVTTPCICDACGHVLTGGSVLCTNCGHRLDGQGDTHTSVVKAVKVVPIKDAAWPMVFGIISIVLGGLSLVPAIASTALMLMNATTLAVGLVALGAGALQAALASWLIRAGRRVWRRKPDSIDWLRAWAWTIVGLALLLSFSAVTILGSFSEQIHEVLAEHGYPNVNLAEAGIRLALVLTPSLIWPAVILIFTSTPGARREINSWR